MTKEYIPPVEVLLNSLEGKVHKDLPGARSLHIRRLKKTDCPKETRDPERNAGRTQSRRARRWRLRIEVIEAHRVVKDDDVWANSLPGDWVSYNRDRAWDAYTQAVRDDGLDAAAEVADIKEHFAHLISARNQAAEAKARWLDEAIEERRIESRRMLLKASRELRRWDRLLERYKKFFKLPD
jgi:hypothetical protein